jgi:uncharacterized protein YjbJ (UPF0337 family)
LERYSSSHSSYGWFAGHNTSIFYQLKENDIVDKNRIEGSVKQVKGSIEEAAGKVLGDAKLTAKGKGDKVAGNIQNAVGSVSDSLTKGRK